MPNPIINPDKAHDIAVSYVCSKENMPRSSVIINSFEPFEWCGEPAFLFKGSLDIQSVLKEPRQVDVFDNRDNRSFSIWVDILQGQVIGYKPDLS